MQYLSGANMVRLFVSINVPIEIKEKLASFQNKLVDLVIGNFVPLENLHISLKFLGEVKDEQVDRIKSLCDGAISHPKFMAEIKGVGAFPNAKFARVLWAGVTAGDRQLASIENALRNKLEPLGFKDEREFHAHATLARVKKIRNRDALTTLFRNNKATIFGAFRVENVSLMKSELRRDSPTYSAITKFGLI